MSKSRVAKHHHIDHALISPNALIVVKKLQKNGYQAYLVGGCIRDILLQKSPKDFDVVTSANPEQVKKSFRNCRLIGRRFRLAHILFGREVIEVATFRSSEQKPDETKTLDGRVLFDNVYGKSLKEDALRRDFTINALCYDPVKRKIFDFSSGLDDLDKKQIRILGEAEQRYREDPVRMLRAIRFKAKLGFSIESKTNKAIDLCRDTLFSVPPARLFDESLKMFQTGHAVESFEQLRQHKLLSYFYPDLEQLDELREVFIMSALANTDKRISQGMSVNPAFLIAVFLWHDVFQGAKKITGKAKMPLAIAIQKSATEILSKQCRLLAIPRRFTNVMRDIWGLQYRLEKYQGGKAKKLLQHPRFRAGYDFLCLRAEAEPGLKAKSEWWTQMQVKYPIEKKSRHYSTRT